MLAHQLSKAERQVVEAQAAVDEATRLHQPMDSTSVTRVKHRLYERQRNLEYVFKKQHRLNVYGIALFDKGAKPHEFSPQEYQWSKVAAETAMSNGGRSSTAAASSCAATGEAAAARAVAPTDAVVLEKLDAAKPDYAAALSTPPAPWLGASD